jgi:hypothetical protein
LNKAAEGGREKIGRKMRKEDDAGRKKDRNRNY